MIFDILEKKKDKVIFWTKIRDKMIFWRFPKSVSVLYNYKQKYLHPANSWRSATQACAPAPVDEWQTVGWAQKN